VFCRGRVDIQGQGSKQAASKLEIAANATVGRSRDRNGGACMQYNGPRGSKRGQAYGDLDSAGARWAGIMIIDAMTIDRRLSTAG
jgi:hypothetical protein